MLAGIPMMEGVPNAEATPMNTSTPPARILGYIRGIVTFHKVRSGEAPDIREASSSVGSIFSMAREIVIKANGA